jgi:hypothetical protein
VIAQGLHFIGDRPRAWKQGPPRLGQAWTVGRAIEKRDAELLFETLNGIGDRGLRPVQPPRGAGKAALLNDRQKDP